eukprot:GGOE01009328.1.p1 GENE.GGOE01009328.1~~GGOE01009328.1.p1  ORF type:complete len:123 (-),score=6.37 GGOE01009328.1:47-415(-)
MPHSPGHRPGLLCVPPWLLLASLNSLFYIPPTLVFSRPLTTAPVPFHLPPLPPSQLPSSPLCLPPYLCASQGNRQPAAWHFVARHPPPMLSAPRFADLPDRFRSMPPALAVPQRPSPSIVAL